MMFFRSLILFGAASVLLGQTPPPSSPTPPATPQPAAPKPAAPATPPGPQVQLSVDNPAAKPPDVPPDRVVITVGDIKITAGQFNTFVEGLPAQYHNPRARKQLADNIAKTLTLAQEAEKRKLDQTPEFKVQSLLQSYNLLANALATQIGKDATVSEADVRGYYEAHKAEFEMVHAKHILVRFQGSQVPLAPGAKDLTPEEALAKAQDIRKKIQDGGDFAALAKTESDDKGSAMNGGDMPPFQKGKMVPSFEQAAWTMKAGELSEPVKSQYGYHIILVVSHDTKTFEQVRPELETRMKPEQNQKAVNKAIEDLQKANPPVLDPEFFPPPPAPLTPPTLVPTPGKQ